MLNTQQGTEANKIQLRKASQITEEEDQLKGRAIATAIIDTCTLITSILIPQESDMSAPNFQQEQDINPILETQIAHSPEPPFASALVEPSSLNNSSSLRDPVNFPSFDWENKWLKGDEYAFMLEHIKEYCSVYKLSMYPRKTHPEDIYRQPLNGLIYFVEGNCVGSEFGFPRVPFRKQYRWKKMNFTTDLPKKRPQVTYIVASSVRCQKHGQGNQKNNINEQKDVFRMHAVILYKNPGTKVTSNETKQYILCHIRKIDISSELEKVDLPPQGISTSNELSVDLPKTKINSELEDEEDEDQESNKNIKKKKISAIEIAQSISKNNNKIRQKVQQKQQQRQDDDQPFSVIHSQRKMSEGSAKIGTQIYESPTYPLQLNGNNIRSNLLNQDKFIHTNNNANEIKQNPQFEQDEKQAFSILQQLLSLNDSEAAVNKKVKYEQMQNNTKAQSPNRKDSSHSSTSNQIKEEDMQKLIQKQQQQQSQQIQQQLLINNLLNMNQFNNFTANKQNVNHLASLPLSLLNQPQNFVQNGNLQSNIIADQTNLNLQFMFMQQQQQQQKVHDQQQQLQMYLNANQNQNLFNQLTLTSKNQDFYELISKILSIKQPNQELNYQNLFNLSHQFNFPQQYGLLLSQQSELLQQTNNNNINVNNKSNSTNNNNQL